MSEVSFQQHFAQALLIALEETFEKVIGIYLDRGTSIFETLATITAEEASRPLGNCATIAAHVAHMSFYMEITLQFVRGERPQVDWTEIWRTVSVVTPDEWAASQQKLRESYASIRELAQSMFHSDNQGQIGEDEIGGALGMLMHNAYHLGEIRQALCHIKPDRSI